MQKLRALYRLFASIGFAMLLWLHAAQTALAAATPNAPPEEKGYTKEYALVALGIALGVLVVCRSANRTTEIKYEDE
jgi:hypothetical protein